MFSIRGDYLSEAINGNEEYREVLETIGSYSGNIELVLSGPIERPLTVNSHVEAAKEFDLEPKAAHAASKFQELSNEDGVSELLTRLRNMQLKSKRVERERIDWSPEFISIHPPRLEREEFEDSIKNSTYNLSQLPFHIKDDIIEGEVLVENIASRHEPNFALESVEDAELWEKQVLGHLPDYAQDNVAYVVDVSHTDYPNEMIDILDRNTKEYHLHNREPVEENGEISGDNGELYDMHRAPWDGEIDMNEILNKIDDISTDYDPALIWEVKPEHLSPETIDETYDRFGYV